MYLMNGNEINDKRSKKEFKGVTFSKFKKSDVKKELLNSLNNGRIEPACYWSAEFICAGHFLELWDNIILFATKHIHLGNPKLSLYLQLRFNNFKDILVGGYIDNEIKMRNNKKIRSLFGEIISILALSNKKHTLSKVKIDKDDFQLQNITDKLKADNINYANRIYLKDDPKELFIALNEFAYNLTSRRNKTVDACYWLEWIMEFENVCKREKKIKLMAAPRHIAPVENKMKTDIIWMIWEIFLLEAENRGGITKKIVSSLLEIFSIKYTSGTKRKRRFLMYNVISLLTEPVDYNISIFTEEKKIDTIKNKIDIIYKQIKNNEVRPDTDYLFNNSFTGDERNLENTIKKLDQMNNMMYIPRDK